MISEDVNKKFLTKTEDTGRHIVYSYRTGKTYYIEPIDNYRGTYEPIHDAGYIESFNAEVTCIPSESINYGWGDLNPSTGKVEGSYGKKYKGSIRDNESLITEENGFINIEYLSPGYNPYAEIDRRDAMYPSLNL